MLWRAALPELLFPDRRTMVVLVIERKDLGAWLEGAPHETGYVKGSSLGLPAEGPGSVAPFWRRPLSVVIDWGLCMLASALVFDGDALANLVLFVAMNVLFLTLFGATVGQFVLKLRVRPVRGRSPMLLRSLIRTGMILLLLPTVVWNKDAQPLHDVAAGTAVITV